MKRRATYDDEPLVTIFELMARLEKGAQGSGVQLTANECFILTRARATLEAALGPKPKRGRPNRTRDIAWACIARRWQRIALKRAIAFTMDEFNCSQATVYNALEKYNMLEKHSK